MPLVKVKNKYQVTLPTAVRQRAGVGVGDLLEAQVEKGKITFTPTAVVDRDEYTPAQRRAIDREIAKGLEDIKKGRTYGPFNTVEDMAASIERNIKNSRRAAKKPKPVR